MEKSGSPKHPESARAKGGMPPASTASAHGKIQRQVSERNFSFSTPLRPTKENGTQEFFDFTVKDRTDLRRQPGIRYRLTLTPP
jgi:hypothetical protein